MSTPKKTVSVTQPTLDGTSPDLRYTDPDGNHYPTSDDPPASREAVARLVSQMRDALESTSRKEKG